MFKNDPSVSRMVDYFESSGISKRIRDNTSKIEEHIKDQLENKVSFTTGNRTDAAQQRYEVNKLNDELKSTKKIARLERKKETASAMADMSQTIDSYEDLLSSIEGSFSDKYMLEIVASLDSDLEDIAKIVGYIGRYVPDRDIEVDGRSIDIVFTGDSKLGKIVNKMGANAVEKNIAHDLKAYGGAGVVIHEPDSNKSMELVGSLRKGAVEDEEGYTYTSNSTNNEEDVEVEDEEQSTEDDFEKLVGDYGDTSLNPEILNVQQKVISMLNKKQVNENSTASYLSEQVRKDSTYNVIQEKSVSFKEKYRPKTHWQLEELRSYGL
jgi:hypothetical protein